MVTQQRETESPANDERVDMQPRWLGMSDLM